MSAVVAARVGVTCASRPSCSRACDARGAGPHRRVSDRPAVRAFDTRKTRRHLTTSRVMEDPAAAAAAASAAVDAANAVLTEEKAAEVVATVTEASAPVVDATTAAVADAGAVVLDATTAAVASASDAVVSALGGAEAVTAAGEAVGAAVASLDAASTAAAATAAGAAVADEAAVAAGAVAGKAVAATGAALLVKNVATMSLAKDMWATYSGLLSVYPLATKSVTGSFLYSLSDGIAQKATAAKASADEDDGGGATSADDASDRDERREIDRGRVARFAAWGPIDAFMTTAWYGVLDSWTEAVFPPDAASAADPDAVAGVATHAVNWSKVAFEVAADQTVYCPIWFLAFFSFTGIWERRPAVETATRIKTEIVPAVTTSWWIWVPVMTVSFGFVPSELRVPYYLVASFAYAMLLSALWGDAGAAEERSEEDA